MSLLVLNNSINIITIEKDKKKYGMTCAWASQVDYDKLIMLLGRNSQTAKKISIGDYIGVNVLNKEQKNISTLFGFNHSEDIDKFKDLSYKIDEGAILINDCARIIKAKVLDIIHLKKLEEDYLIYCEIVEIDEHRLDFLNAIDTNLDGEE